jgi:small multidrug resistance pump
MAYVYLTISIILEVIGTSLLKMTSGFTAFWPTVGVFICYAVAFFLMSLVMKTLPVGIVYAIWSGCGIILVSIASYFLYKQQLDLPALLGIGLIITGVAVINLFSKSITH